MLTKEEFIKYLEESGIPYKVERLNDEDKTTFVYAYDRGIYDLVKSNPEKYRHLYIPYIRVSGFDDWTYYVRDNGLVDYMPTSELLSRLEEYR